MEEFATVQALVERLIWYEVSVDEVPLPGPVALIQKDELEHLYGQGEEEAIRERLLPAAVRVLQAHLVHHPLPLPQEERSVEDTLALVKAQGEKLAQEDRLSGRLSTGVRFLRQRFPSYWEAGAAGGALGMFRDKEKLTQVVAYRLGLNESREVFDLSFDTVLRGVIVGRHMVSTFKPGVAAALYKRWLPQGRPVVVWDPSGGFGARMLGFAAVAQGTYIANEPASKTRADLLALAQELGNCVPDFQALIQKEGSEVAAPWCPVDMVFTSPPYFDKERYFDEPGQCWRDYPTEARWISGFLKPTLRRAFHALRPGGILALNVDWKRRPAVVQQCEALGFISEKTQRLLLGVDHFQRKQGGEPRDEPILVFRRPAGPVRVAVRGTGGRYEVDDQGNMWSFTRNRRGKQIFGTTHASGYLSVGVTPEAGGSSTTQLVHRLVCAAFHGEQPSPEHTDVRHLDGDKKNNRADNLAWGTRSENMYVLTPRAGRSGDVELVKVCASLVAENKLEIVDVERLLDCSTAVASDIIRGRTHRHLPVARTAARKQRPKMRRLDIRALFRKGLSREQVNEALGEDLTPQEAYYYKKTSHRGV